MRRCHLSSYGLRHQVVAQPQQQPLLLTAEEAASVTAACTSPHCAQCGCAVHGHGLCIRQRWISFVEIHVHLSDCVFNGFCEEVNRLKVCFGRAACAAILDLPGLRHCPIEHLNAGCACPTVTCVRRQHARLLSLLPLFKDECCGACMTPAPLQLTF